MRPNDRATLLAIAKIIGGVIPITGWFPPNFPALDGWQSKLSAVALLLASPGPMAALAFGEPPNGNNVLDPELFQQGVVEHARYLGMDPDF